MEKQRPKGRRFALPRGEGFAFGKAKGSYGLRPIWGYAPAPEEDNLDCVHNLCLYSICGLNGTKKSGWRTSKNTASILSTLWTFSRPRMLKSVLHTRAKKQDFLQ